MEYSISFSEILVALLFILASGLGFIIKEQKEKLKSIRSQLSEKKYNLYNEIYSILFDLLKEKKGDSKQSVEDRAAKLMDNKKDLLIYAPDDVVKKFIEWNRFINTYEGDLRHVKLFLELYILIRKDMGHPKTTISESDILKIIMTTDSNIEAMMAAIEL